MKKIEHNDVIEVVPCVMLIFILVIIGCDIGINMRFFYIDNPAVLMLGASNIDALISSIVQNPRLDFSYNIIIYFTAKLFGNTTTVHFMVQYLFYFMTIFFVLYFLKNYIDKKRIAVVCSSLLVWCSPIGENIYTIGKKEIPMTFGMVVFVICLFKLAFEQQSQRKRAGIYIAYIVAIIFSLTLKETSAVIVLPIVMLFAYVCIVRRETVVKMFGSCLCVLVAVILMQAYKRLFVVNSSYTEYELTYNVIIDNMSFYLKYHADVCFIAIMGLISSMILFLKDIKNERYAYLLIINLTGWGYVGGICLWRWPQSYYLYPAILFFTISLGSFFILVQRKVLYGIFIFAGVVFALYGANYSYRVAKSHKDLSIIYTDSIYCLDSIVKSKDKIIIDNAELYEEPVVRMRNLLVAYMGNDISINGGRQSIWGIEVTEERLNLYGYTREKYEEERECAVLREGDYLVHYIHNSNYYGAVRAVNPADTADTISYLEEQGYTFELIEEELINSKYWGWSDKYFGWHNMQTGYQIYKVISQAGKS